MAQLDVAAAPGEERELTRLLAGLAGARINVTFLAMRPARSCWAVSLCLAEPQRARAEEIALRTVGARQRLTILGPVVSASLFPHHSRGTILRVTSRLVSEASMPLLTLATSLSAVTFTVGAAHLPLALKSIHGSFHLPANHSPPLAEPHLLGVTGGGERRALETAARYQEKVIRTYGFDLLPDLTLVRVSWPLSEECTASSPDGDAGEIVEQRLAMAVAARNPGESSAIWVIASGGSSRAAETLGVAGSCVASTRPVDVVRFHGPHFGDRRGIAAATLSSLLETGLWPLLVSCTGASVHVALPQGAGAAAVAALSTRFSAPAPFKQRGRSTP